MRVARIVPRSMVAPAPISIVADLDPAKAVNAGQRLFMASLLSPKVSRICSTPDFSGVTKAETVAADHGIGLSDETVADHHPVQDCARRSGDQRVITDLRSLADADMAGDAGARADAGAATDHHEEADGGTR